MSQSPAARARALMDEISARRDDNTSEGLDALNALAHEYADAIGLPRDDLDAILDRALAASQEPAMRAILGTYSPVTFTDARERAEARAAQYPGSFAEWVPPGPHGLGGGYYQVVHPDAEGLPVTDYLHVTLPEGTTLQRCDSVQANDVVWSSHYGTRVVAKAETRGIGAGTTYLWVSINFRTFTEARAGDLPIPVLARADDGRRRVEIRWTEDTEPIGSFGIHDAVTGGRFRGPFHKAQTATAAAERAGYFIISGPYGPVSEGAQT